jgi:hypothetical protein
MSPSTLHPHRRGSPTGRLARWLVKLEWDKLYDERDLAALAEAGGILYDPEAKQLVHERDDGEHTVPAPVFTPSEWQEKQLAGVPARGGKSAFNSLWRMFRGADLLAAVWQLWVIEDPGAGLPEAEAFAARIKVIKVVGRVK